MPISKYNKKFGGNALKAYLAMIRKYGVNKGKQVFYATARGRK